VRRAGRDEPNLLTDADDRRLWKKFQLLKQLNERDQATIFRMMSAFVDKTAN